MTTDNDEGEPEILPPDDAFAVLGNETRMDILRTLGGADDPLPFSELRDRVGLRDSGQFNYHLDKLEGHFVRKTDSGYDLRNAGYRVIDAVHSGAVTEAPVMEPSEVDALCSTCESELTTSFQEGMVRLYCPECAGNFDDSAIEDPLIGDRLDNPEEYGFLGGFLLPPAGVHGRTPTEVLETAYTWGRLELHAAHRGICPRCSARIEDTVSVCEEHDATDGLCDQCGYSHAAIIHFDCTNCTIAGVGASHMRCHLGSTEVLEFLTAHGEIPFDRNLTGELWSTNSWDENVVSVEPFEAEYSYTIDDETLTVTLDDDLSIVEVTTTTASESHS